MSENDNEFLDIGNMFVAQCSQYLQKALNELDFDSDQDEKIMLQWRMLPIY